MFLKKTFVVFLIALATAIPVGGQDTGVTHGSLDIDILLNHYEQL